MNKNIIFLLIPIMVFGIQCEPDHETVEVSKVSEMPKFEYIGGQFISFVKGTRSSFVDPGVIATVDGKEVRVISYSPGEINTSQVNVYVFYYFAQNEDRIISEGRRIVAITYEDVSNNDYIEGKYIISNWDPVEVKVKKINNNGWYSCSDVLGYPGIEVKGEFVDIGKGELVLLPGESYFGDYDISEGNYTQTSLQWSVYLIDPPYSGIEIPVTLIKLDE